jgi:DNA-binding CsgD family transcriptional regulator
MPLLRLNEQQWFDRIGRLAQCIGSHEFHHELVDLFGASIRHESCWIIRYSRNALPEVLFTHNVPDEVVGTYSSTYSEVCPFSDYWKYNGQSGVIMLADAVANSPRSETYRRVFLPRANISDEMSIFLPTVGQDCYGFFLERENGHFSRSDVERARLVFPALEGCHRAHLGWLFANLHKACELERHGLTNKPLLIQDRFGAEIYSNDAWNEALTADRALSLRLEDLSTCGEDMALLDGWALKSEILSTDFPLAPRGRMFVLEPHFVSPGVDENVSADSDAPSELSRRERDIFSLIMKGCTTGQIAQTLKISKGVIKNYKVRIYRKTQVDSERALVRKFATAFLNEVRHQ